MDTSQVVNTSSVYLVFVSFHIHAYMILAKVKVNRSIIKIPLTYKIPTLSFTVIVLHFYLIIVF